MPPKKFIDPELLRKHVRYVKKTGQFILKVATERLPAGHIFSTRYADTYVHIQVDGVSYAAHRAAWVYVTGEQPDEVDHWNGFKHDNRWSNLRNVSHGQNMRNHHANKKLTFHKHKQEL